MKGEFLLEIGTEEIPAGFCHVAGQGLVNLFARAIDSARIPYESLKHYATPRRLILTASIESQQPPVEVEKTGPPKASAFDDKGNPTKAAIGFAKSQGVAVSDLEILEKGGKEVVAVRKTEGGRPTDEVLAQTLPGLFERIPFPKTMRWMDLDVRFGRPVHWIVALYDGKVIPCRYGNIESSNRSRGHRFVKPDRFVVSSLDDLRTTLESQGVTIDQDLRSKAIREEIDKLADTEGLSVFDDPELLDEITFLVESPYPLMGEFDAEFLEIPSSILTTCLKKHQRYFSLTDGDGNLTNRFIAVNNTPVKDPASSIRGHQRVLKARLEDARFYFLDDRKRPLISRLEELKGVVFHSKLGTSYEKVRRFSQLAGDLAESFAPEKIEDVERAANLAKCDLETGIVYEFPEVQGIIGSTYAEMDGEPPEVAAAVREHYLPAFAGDRLPEGIIGSVVSIADRIDTIAGCFGVGLLPTGTADPYALRRHAFAIIQLLIHLDRTLFLRNLVREALTLLGEKLTRDAGVVEREIMEFFRTRFVNLHTSLNYPLDVVEAVVRARFEDVVDVRRRVEALDEWKQRDDFDAIMVGFKRVVNILKDTEQYVVSEDLLIDDGEKLLFEAFTEVRDRTTPLIEQGRYSEALEIMAELKNPIDKFFDDVMVMVEETNFRQNRLALLQEIAGLFSGVADFSFVGSTA